MINEPRWLIFLVTGDKHFIFNICCPKLQEQQDSSPKPSLGEVLSFVQQKCPGVASLFPATRSLVFQTYNNAMPAKKFYLNFLMPATWYDKSYKGSFILSDRRGHHHQTPETDLQGLSEKLCTLKRLIPSQQSEQYPYITGKTVSRVGFELQWYFNWRLLSSGCNFPLEKLLSYFSTWFE